MVYHLDDTFLCLFAFIIFRSTYINNEVVNIKYKYTDHLFIHKVVISVCPIIIQEPQDRFAKQIYWGTREAHGNVLSLVLRS